MKRGGNPHPFLGGTMKVLALKLGGKTYTTGKVTAYIAKEVIKIGKQALELAKSRSVLESLGEDSSEEELDRAAEIVSQVEELANKKAWVLCEAYGNKFTQDDLEKGLSSQEIDAEVNRLMGAITGTIEKN